MDLSKDKLLKLLLPWLSTVALGVCGCCYLRRILRLSFPTRASINDRKGEDEACDEAATGSMMRKRLPKYFENKPKHRPGALRKLEQQEDHSWLRCLRPDPETDRHAPNRDPREVKAGHYVLLDPTPLPDPRLILLSDSMAKSLGLTEEQVESEDFVRFFSGERQVAPRLASWCTPYALSIMGEEYSHQCIFGTGNGYGDGRAISVGEVVADGVRWEMQLKGGGRTPFCRRADGRAVLRSSIREFLASEAMYHLGIETTRALCLVASGSESVARSWYGEKVIRDEQCAITTRVAASFLRVGHLDHFARRARRSNATPQQKHEHRLLVEHAFFREFPEVQVLTSFDDKCVRMLELAAERFATLMAGWLRVGFCQGNFNGDNCLIAGRTMDYGPFGFVERYDPHFALWVNSGKHFSFRNQPEAALANYSVLVKSVLLDRKQSKKQQLLVRAMRLLEAAEARVWRQKMGLDLGDESSVAKADQLWLKLEKLLEISDVDFTIFWRLLSKVLETPERNLVSQISDAFYGTLKCGLADEWEEWLQDWKLTVVSFQGKGQVKDVVVAMNRCNPKYVPREWMLVDAYEKAQQGNYEAVHELYELFIHPYEEQPEFEEKYFRKAPDEVRDRGGIAYMT